MKYHKIYSCLAVVVSSFVFITHVCAQNEVLTLSEARQQALEQNKEIQKANVTVQQTGYDMKAYKSNFFPRISLHATDAYSTSGSKLDMT